MGNTNSGKHQSKQRRKGTTELVHLYVNSADCAEENYIESSQCCWLKFDSLKKRKIIWQKNFVAHCLQVRDEFKWASMMIQLIKLHSRPKGSFFQEINDLKTEMLISSEESEREILITPSQVEQFKSNLKRSVILSSSQANKYYYHDSAHKISSTMGSIPNKPTRIEFQRFCSSNSFRTSLGFGSKKAERTASIGSRSGLRKSIMSFVDDTLSSVVGAEREISRQMANHLQVFLKFTMVIEKHFNNPQCMLFHIKSKFIDFICNTYYNPEQAALRIGELVDSVNQFMIIMKQAVFDYYNLNSFGEGESFCNPFITNEDNILSLCKSIFFKEKRFYDTVFNAIIKFNDKREEDFKKIIMRVASNPPENFYVKERFCLNERTIESATKIEQQVQSFKSEQGSLIQDSEPYRNCKLILNELQRSLAPVSKMKIVHYCSEMMNKQIQKFYDVNGLQRQKWVLDADQVLSIFCYVIVGARIEHLHSHLFFMDNFSTSSQMISIFGYFVSVMNCAVQQLQSEYLQELNEERNDM